MRYVRLGRTNLTVSRLGLDCHSLGTTQRDRGWDPMSYDGQVFAIRTVHAALDAGINVFDTSADISGVRGETLLGKALGERPSDVMLASQARAWESEADIERSIVASLRRLRAEHIHILYLSDRVEADGRNGVAQEAMLSELQRLRRRGMIGAIGLAVSEPLRAAFWMASGSFDVAQIQCNLAKRGPIAEFIDACVADDIGVGIIKPPATRALKTVADALDADWRGSGTVRECCLRYLLADRRVQLVNAGMRWEHEIAASCRLFAEPTHQTDTSGAALTAAH